MQLAAAFSPRPLLAAAVVVTVMGVLRAARGLNRRSRNRGRPTRRHCEQREDGPTYKCEQSQLLLRATSASAAQQPHPDELDALIIEGDDDAEEEAEEEPREAVPAWDEAGRVVDLEGVPFI